MKYVVANYKMNGNTELFDKVQTQLNKLCTKDTKIVLCPPFVYLPILNCGNFCLGAQDVSCCTTHKYTGEISAKMLKEFGVEYCIVSHADRKVMGESIEQSAKKVLHCVENGIIPIICVGEQNKNQNIDILKKQLKQSCCYIKNAKLIVAYEPVSAIGDKPDDVKKIEFVANKIREWAFSLGVEAKVLYGGGVNKLNCKQILSSGVDGVLLGKASLLVDDFVDIVLEVENE